MDLDHELVFYLYKLLHDEILLEKFLKQSGINVFGVKQETINANVSKALARLYTYQSDSGGWSLWGGNENVEPYLTSYVLTGMQQAREAGFTIDTNVLEK